MKTARIRKKDQKETKVEQQDYSLKSMIKILLIILLIFCIFYFLTMFLSRTSNKSEEFPVALDDSKIMIKQLLNRKEKEYYVLAIKESLYNETGYITTDYIKLYNSYINDYAKKDNSLRFYYIDLDNALNKNYFGEKANITEDLENIVLNNETLFKIKDSKIEKIYIGKDEIIDKLSRL